MNFYSQLTNNINVGISLNDAVCQKAEDEDVIPEKLQSNSLIPKMTIGLRSSALPSQTHVPKAKSLDNSSVLGDSKPLASEIQSGLISKIKRVFWGGMGVWGTYNLIDSGLARFFALETLTHGAGPLGYIGISLNGADPNYGGGKTGSSVAFGQDYLIRNSKNYFHVFKDSAFSGTFCDSTPVPMLCNTFANQLLPRYHAILSGMANFGYSAANKSGNLVQGAIGAVSGFLTPTLKFRFTPEEVINCSDTCRFEDDPDYNRAAYRTSKAINATHLGITGCLSQGINSGTFDRMSDNPGKVLLGITLLGTAALVARTTYRYINSGQQVGLNTGEISPSFTSQSTSHFQNCKKRLRVLAVNSCWATLGVCKINCVN